MGAEGYSPIGFNPLYPNANGAVEDEQKRTYDPDKFSARGIAKDILFGSGPSKDNLARFGSASDPRNALGNVSPSYSAVRRNELKNKLGIDVTSSAIKEDFMSRYRASYQGDDKSAQKRQAVCSLLKTRLLNPKKKARLCPKPSISSAISTLSNKNRRNASGRCTQNRV